MPGLRRIFLNFLFRVFYHPGHGLEMTGKNAAVSLGVVCLLKTSLCRIGKEKRK